MMRKNFQFLCFWSVLADGLKDVKEKLAPIMSSSWGMVVRPREGLGAHAEDSRHSCGFGKGYEEFDKELFMEVDIDRLMHDIWATGFKVYFIYYFLSIFWPNVTALPISKSKLPWMLDDISASLFIIAPWW
jgi:hypothetical protein